MRTLGVIVRADSGGLGNQTWEIWRHMRPERALVVLAGKHSRSAEDVTRYLDHDGTILHEGVTLSKAALKEFAASVDTVFTVETPYSSGGFGTIRSAGARSVLLANPELFCVDDHGWPDVIRCPTKWALDRMPPEICKVLPQPVATDRFKSRVRTGCTTFFHPVAPAMLDRNGTDVVMDALKYVEEPCALIVHAPGVRSPFREPEFVIGKVSVEWRDVHVDHYWEAYPEEADVLVLPRRYGGLCLPAFEAAACGIPAVMTHLSPQTDWPGVMTVKTTHSQQHYMKGGSYPVYRCSPKTLGAELTGVVKNPPAVEQRSRMALKWAHDNSWDALMPQWLGTLR